MYLAFLVWRGAEHNLLAASYLGRSGKHQYGREQWRSATRYVEAYLLYCYALLPACYAFGCLHLCALKLLSLVELCNILVGKDECFFQLFVNKSLSLGYFLVCYGELFQACLVKLLLIGYDGFVAILPDVLEHTLNDAVELRHVHVRTLTYLGVVFFIWKSDNIHSYDPLFVALRHFFPEREKSYYNKEVLLLLVLSSLPLGEGCQRVGREGVVTISSSQ